MKKIVNRKVKSILIIGMAILMFPTLGFAEYQDGLLPVTPDDNPIAYAYLDGQWNSSGTKGSADAGTYYTTPPGTDYYLAVRLERFENRTDRKPIEHKYKHHKLNAGVSLDKAKTYCFKSRHSVDNSAGTKELVSKRFSDYN